MYKAGQGMVSRIGAMIVGVLIAAYASFSWYRWQPFATGREGSAFTIDLAIALAILVGAIILFGRMVFRMPSYADYLIDMDDELKKVVWPTVLPLFDPKTEAWGSTYVVIVCAILFTLFIWVTDIVLQFVINGLLFPLIFG